MSTKASSFIYFGPFEVTSQVFLTTPHSFALVNLKPLLPGHVLVCPNKPHKRLTDLSTPELTDLFQQVQRVQRMLATHYFKPPQSNNSKSPNSNTEEEPTPGTPEAGSFNIAIQDGVGAGQTVPHVHVHIIPRIKGLTEKLEGPSDELYEYLADERGNVGGHLWDRDQAGRPRPGGYMAKVDDQDRKPRSLEVMDAEAEVFRGLLRDMEGD